jgi:hypothetical protein
MMHGQTNVKLCQSYESQFAILQTSLEVQNSPAKLHLPEKQINIQ